MKNKRKHNPLISAAVVMFVLILMAAALSIGLYYYIFGISEPEGLSPASWPRTFTDNFTVWMDEVDGAVKVKDIGLKRLEEYGLWLQVIDEKGQEVYNYHKPEVYPVYYSAAELMAFETSACENGYTVFTGDYTKDGRTWGYIVGFPYAVGKHMLYYNGGTVGRLFPVFRTGIVFAIGAVVLCILLCGFWLVRHLDKIAGGIGRISLRTYTPLPEEGVFCDIYASLNGLDADICRSDRLQQETERMRREWIANVTHDLKTPLSPVRGYAELLAGDPEPERETVRAYGKIILKNTNHLEKLINDLKLTYQLESGGAPYHPKEVRLIRCLKEIVIDIVNDPAFEGRDIAFASNVPEMMVCIDMDLFRRAVQNIIINALTHNPPETKVTVCAESDPQEGLFIFIRDNGKGMSEAEQSELWNRYYRGTSTKEKPEGSGLGLAIAKQIIKLHGGDIAVKSRPGEGTQFTIILPDKK